MPQVYPYQYSDLKASINTRIHNKMGLVATPRTLINDVVNEVSNLQLRSSIKKAVLAPNLFNDIYQYASPSDIDGHKLIGIQPQSMERSRNNVWSLVSEEEFDQYKQSMTNLVAFSDHSFVRGLLISARTANLRQLTIANLQGTTGDSSTGASWAAFGQASNLQTDTYNFIKGSGSLQFDILTGGNTAGVTLTSTYPFDLTQYYTSGSVFSWVYLTTASNVTSVSPRVANNIGNSYLMTATTPNDGTSFVNGWNLVRFDFNTKTITGSPVITTCTYVSIYLNLVSSTVVDAGYRVNWMNAKQGNISNLIYYSEFPWISSNGTQLARSISDSDYLVCDQDEYNLFVEKGVQVIGMAAREYQDAQLAMQRYEGSPEKPGMARQYKMNYPSEALVLTSTYYNV